MSNQTTLVGNVTRAPELRFTASGQATASFGLAVNRRWQNRQTNEWEEAVSFFDVTTWRNLAENCAESLDKGTRVVVTGRLEQQTWERDGEKKSKVVLVADAVGPDLTYASAAVTKNERTDDPGARRSAPVPNTAPAGYDDEPFALVVGMTDDVPQPLRRALLA